MVTADGTAAVGLLLDSTTVAPPAGATAVRPTVPCAPTVPTRRVGMNLTLCSAACAESGVGPLGVPGREPPHTAIATPVGNKAMNTKGEKPNRRFMTALLKHSALTS